MKSERERKEIIDAINVMLNQAYDSTLDDIFELLQKIEDEEDENDLKAYDEAKKNLDIVTVFIKIKVNNYLSARSLAQSLHTSIEGHQQELIIK